MSKRSFEQAASPNNNGSPPSKRDTTTTTVNNNPSLVSQSQQSDIKFITSQYDRLGKPLKPLSSSFNITSESLQKDLIELKNRVEQEATMFDLGTSIRQKINDQFGLLLRGNGNYAKRRCAQIAEYARWSALILASTGYILTPLQKYFRHTMILTSLTRMVGTRENNYKEYSSDPEFYHDELRYHGLWCDRSPDSENGVDLTPEEVHPSRAYMCCMMMPRQYGKTTMGALHFACLMGSIRNIKIGVLGQLESTCTRNLQAIIDFMAIAVGGIQNLEECSDKSQTRIIFQPHNKKNANGLNSMAKIYSENSLRGSSDDEYWIDEAAFVKETLISMKLLPIAANPWVGVICTTTPNEQNQFWADIMKNHTDHCLVREIRKVCNYCESLGPELAQLCPHKDHLIPSWQNNIARANNILHVMKSSPTILMQEFLGMTLATREIAFQPAWIDGLTVNMPDIVALQDNMVFLGVDPNIAGPSHLALELVGLDTLSKRYVLLGSARGDARVTSPAFRKEFIMRFLSFAYEKLRFTSIRTGIESNFGPESAHHFQETIDQWALIMYEKYHIGLTVSHEDHMKGGLDTSASVHDTSRVSAGLPPTQASNKKSYYEIFSTLMAERKIVRLKNYIVLANIGEMQATAIERQWNICRDELRRYVKIFNSVTGMTTYTGKDPKERHLTDDWVMAAQFAAYIASRRTVPAKNRVVNTTIERGHKLTALVLTAT